MNILEDLGVCTRGLEETMHPFETWAGSPIQTWGITMKMLDMGDLVDIAKLTATASPVEATYLSKVYLLAKSIRFINNQPIVNSEDLEAYNKSHNLTGTHQLDTFEYKVLFIKKLTEAVVNRLTNMYDQIVDRYIEQIIGKPLPEELKTAKVDEVDLSVVDVPINRENDAEPTDKTSEDSSTT